MKNNLVSKTVNKGVLFGIIAGAILLLSIVFSAIFGVNGLATTKNANTLTVKMDTIFYNQVEDLETLCEEEFDACGLNVKYVYRPAEKNGQLEVLGLTCEIVYVFEDGKNVAENLATAKANIVEKLAVKTSANGEWYGYKMQVKSGNEDVAKTIPTSYVVKAIVVSVVLSLLVGVYAAIRYGLWKGVITAGATWASMLLATAVILLTRIPVSTGMFYAVAVGGLISAVFNVLTLSKMRGADENEKGEALVVNGVDCQGITMFSVLLGGALVLVGVIATAAVRWVALCSFIALAAAFYVALCIVPSALLALQKYQDKKAAESTASGYVGAKKADDAE